MTRALLSARAVGRRYGRRVALTEADVDVHAGDAIALLGPNGAGKSTLLSVLAGAVEPSDGEIVFGEPSPVVGWVPQRPALYGRLSPRENLELFAALEGLPRPAATAGALLERVELADEAVPAAQLSVGNQQRLNLAIALLAGPDLLLLDEPTASLDPRHRRRLWELASEVVERGGAIVFATQHLEEVHSVANRVLTLRDGRLIFDGTVDEYEHAPEADVFA